MKFFNLDSPLMKVLNRLTDILWLNILTFFCSIPIITAGASFTALHYVCLKIIRDEEGYVTKEYFKSWKKNFGQATVIWLIVLVVSGLLVADLYCISVMSTNTAILFAAIIAAAIFVLMTALYVFPVLSHFENTIRGTIKNSFYMSIFALPRTILSVLIFVSPLALLYAIEYFETMTWMIPLIFLYGLSGPAYLRAMLYNKVFKKFEPEKESANDDFTWTVGGAESPESDTVVTTESDESGNTEA